MSYQSLLLSLLLSHNEYLSITSTIMLCYVILIGVRGLLWRRRMYSITTPPQVQARSTNTVAPAKTPGLLVF